jgi:hypothetical protein
MNRKVALTKETAGVMPHRSLGSVSAEGTRVMHLLFLLKLGGGRHV